jgi:hypothetical protein
MSRPKSEEDYTLTLSSNGGSAPAEPERPWLKIVEVEAAAMPSPSPWYALFCELKLRLERTTDRHALAVVLAREEDLATAQKSLYHLFGARLGKRSVVIAADVTNDGQPVLFIRRGPNWRP